MSVYYFDMNVIIALMKKKSENLNDIVDNIKKSRKTIVYSPAHIEEVANIIRGKMGNSEKASSIKKHIEFISDLTNGFECLPSHGEILLVEEDPWECYRRVVESYDDSLLAEEIEEMRQSFRSEFAFGKVFGGAIDARSTAMMFEQVRSRYGINIDELRKIAPNDLFRNESVVGALKNETKIAGYEDILKLKYRNIKKSHREIEVTIDYLLNFLEKIGYYSEGAGKHRSKMHDTTHAIYGTRADYYVSGDERHANKVKAVYSFIEAETEVFSLDEFQNLNR